MRKFKLIILTVLFCFIVVSCKTNNLDTTEVDTKAKTKEELLKEAVSKYYLIKQPQNKGELKIYNTKPYKDKYLVLAEKYSGDGHSFTNLLLIDEEYNTIAWTDGETPISMCFSVNKVDYDGNTILFGTFNNTKWDPKTDKKIAVQINKVDIRFSSKQNIKENVSADNGYIVISSPISKVEQFNLYNQKNELQSSLEELGDVNIKTQFYSFEGK